MQALKTLLRLPSGIIGLTIVLFILAVAVVAPIVLMEDATAIDTTQVLRGPSDAHPIGTDALGRDNLARLLVATRLSVSLGIITALLSASFGYTLGASTAVLPLKPRTIVLRFIDMMIAFPGLLIALFVAAILGPGPMSAIIGVALGGTFFQARIASTLALSVGAREYVLGARVVGVSGPRRLFRHVIPNIAETLVLGTSVSISNSIIAVSSLSFLGLGIQAPEFDWGRILTEGVNAIYLNPAAAIAPAIAIAITALAFGFWGEAFARALNPVLWATRGGGRRLPVVAADQVQSIVAPPKLAPAISALMPLEPEPLRTEAKNGAPVVLDVNDLGVSFPSRSGKTQIISGVTFSLHEGEILGVVGESGSGKTMTAMAIAQLVPYPGKVTGSVKLLGEQMTDSARADLQTLLTRIAVVFQDPMSSLNPSLKLGIQLTEGPMVHRKISKSMAWDEAIARLREVYLPTPEATMQRFPHELSGGMRQRIMIAMGLVNSPNVLIADEPTTALDVTIQAQIMELLLSINEHHKTAIILISHNISLLSQVCKRILVMYGGRVVEELPTAHLLRAKHPYTRALLGAVPDLARAKDQPLQAIPGIIPNPADLPPGCAFQTRCPLVIERCRAERPPLVEHPAGGSAACWVTNAEVVTA